MIENIIWLGHATFKIVNKKVIYIDPWKVKEKDSADIILVSHSHFDHLSIEDVEKVRGEGGIVVTTSDSASQLSGDVRTLAPGAKINIDDILIEGVPSYNIGKDFHPRNNNWLGFIITVNGKRIYYAGDTDATPEMKMLTNIDIALLPVGGTYTMTCKEAADAANAFKPKIAVPYHWGDIVGSKSDAEKFKELFEGETVIL
ncbi:MAG TPA: MBL fold metallo-hydrolase [Nitrospinota bacterium]|nr:MBL fold metallo-hydrolase [Nitrospinota bacterium]